MLTLGIETSCDETSVSIVENRRVLSSIVSSSVHLHKKYGGVVPEIASRYHVEYIAETFHEAVKKSGKRLEDIRLVAVTNGPGLVGALLIGISFAKSVAYGLNIPIIGVNHIIAHLNSAFLNEGSDRPKFPFVGLVVSGGHTALFYCEDYDKYRFLGQTQDDAVGEAYDKVSKLLGLGYPGGPVIEKAAKLSRSNDMIKFPKSYLGKDSLDFSFSGIKTAVLYYVRNVQGAGSKRMASDANVTRNICFAFQEAVLDVLVDKAYLAARMSKASRIVVGGGVAANNRFREKFIERAQSPGRVKVYFPRMAYCVDNAAMIGLLGEMLYRKGHRSDLALTAEPNLEV